MTYKLIEGGLEEPNLDRQNGQGFEPFTVIEGGKRDLNLAERNRIRHIEGFKELGRDIDALLEANSLDDVSAITNRTLDKVFRLLNNNVSYYDFVLNDAELAMLKMGSLSHSVLIKTRKLVNMALEKYEDS